MKDSRFTRYETHYALIFNTRKFNITTTIKLNLDFSLIGVYTWIPEDSKSRINDPADARNRLNTRFLGYLGHSQPEVNWSRNISNLISLNGFREKQFASRLADILYFAYESENPAFIKLAIDLCSKAINDSISGSEIQK